MQIEICAPNYVIAKEACFAGADRLEICQNLISGGTTASFAFVEKCMTELHLPVRVLIRPRAGNFNYSKDELEIMIRDIEMCSSLGVEGVVTGALTNEGKFDLRSNSRLREAAKNIKCLFHRGVDLLPMNDIHDIKETGFDGILCSGSPEGVSRGKERLLQIHKAFASDIEIVVGGGVNEENIAWLKDAGFDQIHFSCQVQVGDKRNAYDYRFEFDFNKWEKLKDLA